MHYIKKNPRFLASALAALSLALPPAASAMDSTEVLPAGINSPAFRYGIITGVDSKYTADGSVTSLNEINTVKFDSDQLARISPEVNDLVNILNQYSQQRLGSQINLGTLRVETEPSVNYIAPIYARGITENLSLAVATPIVFYKNKLRLNQSAGNVRATCAEFESLFPTLPELEEACKKLNVKVTDAAQEELARQGFKPLKDRSETVFGDAQLVGLWKFREKGTDSAMLRTTVTLPTGQKNDPDDLADLGVFGLTAVEPMVLFNYLPIRRIRLAAKAGYKYVVPDSPEMRVPGSEGDVIPSPASKENVSRRMGGTVTLGSAVNWYIGEAFMLAGGYEFTQKKMDSFRGVRAARYDLLSRETDVTAHKLRVAVGFDTIAMYQRTKSVPPLKLDYEIVNTIAGRNSDRQLVNELSLSMFF